MRGWPQNFHMLQVACESRILRLIVVGLASIIRFTTDPPSVM